MRLRLFWKILVGFWLTYVLIMEGVWLVFVFYDAGGRQPWKMELMRSVAEVRLGSAAVALELGGEPGLAALRAEWPEREGRRLTLEPAQETSAEAAAASGLDTAGDAPIFLRPVALPDGQRVLLRYDATDFFSPQRPGLLHIPPELLVLGLLGGLLFSALLAWYLTAPVWRLREGFGQLARGRLGIRLTPLMGRRRDEIADLARDFDGMAERMQALVEARERLLNDVSHELRSPLARLHMAIGLARQNPQRIPALLERIEQESSRMDELVGELLTLSRVEYAGCASDEYFDLPGLVRVVAGSARFESEADGVAIDLRMPPQDDPDQASTVRGDAELVRRALENVVRNAVRHSPRGSRVAVSVEPGAEGGCVIRIDDQGPGVPADALERIFEPFVRLDEEGRKTGGRSGGLGLAIARRAITVHGGTIRAENLDRGGLRMTIRLPLEPTDAADDSDAADGPDAATPGDDREV